MPSPSRSSKQHRPARATVSDRRRLKSIIMTPTHATVVEDARRAGLLDGDKSEHVSFRAPPALVAAAKRATGLTSTSALGMLALAVLAQPDPVAAFFKRTDGCLGPDHDLEY